MNNNDNNNACPPPFSSSSVGSFATPVWKTTTMTTKRPIYRFLSTPSLTPILSSLSESDTPPSVSHRQHWDKENFDPVAKKFISDLEQPHINLKRASGIPLTPCSLSSSFSDASMSLDSGSGSKDRLPGSHRLSPLSDVSVTCVPSLTFSMEPEFLDLSAIENQLLSSLDDDDDDSYLELQERQRTLYSSTLFSGQSHTESDKIVQLNTEETQSNKAPCDSRRSTNRWRRSMR